MSVRKPFDLSQIPDVFVRFDINTQGLTGTQQGYARNNIGAETSFNAGATSQYFRGDKSWQTLNTSVVPESGNLYYTDARVRAALLTGYSVGANTALAGTDSILSAMGKIQGQLNAKQASGSYANASHTHDAGNIVSGIIASARLGSGTANSTTYLRGDGTWQAISAGNNGTVTSVILSAPTGFSVSGSPITTSGTLTLSFASGYSLPTTASQTNWNTAFGWGNHSGLYVPTSRSITINGVTLDLSSNRSWTISTSTGTVTSIIAGAGLTGGTISTTGTIAFDYATNDLRYVRVVNSNSDFNTITTDAFSPRIHTGSFAASNAPSGANYWSSITLRHQISGVYETSLMTGTTGGTPEMYIRNRTNGTWASYARIINTLNSSSIDVTFLSVTANAFALATGATRYISYGGTASTNAWISFTGTSGIIMNVPSNETYNFYRGGSAFVNFGGSGIRTYQGGIQTTNTAGRTAQMWKLGDARLSPSPATTRLIRVEIAGTEYDIPAILSTEAV